MTKILVVGESAEANAVRVMLLEHIAAGGLTGVSGIVVEERAPAPTPDGILAAAVGGFVAELLRPLIFPKPRLSRRAKKAADRAAHAAIARERRGAKLELRLARARGKT